MRSKKSTNILPLTSKKLDWLEKHMIMSNLPLRTQILSQKYHNLINCWKWKRNSSPILNRVKKILSLKRLLPIKLTENYISATKSAKNSKTRSKKLIHWSNNPKYKLPSNWPNPKFKNLPLLTHDNPSHII